MGEGKGRKEVASPLYVFRTKERPAALDEEQRVF
jgi:hypothetical protein